MHYMHRYMHHYMRHLPRAVEPDRMNYSADITDRGQYRSLMCEKHSDHPGTLTVHSMTNALGQVTA